LVCPTFNLIALVLNRNGSAHIFWGKTYRDITTTLMWKWRCTARDESSLVSHDPVQLSALYIPAHNAGDKVKSHTALGNQVFGFNPHATQ
jgi:hypothetical protein